MYRLNVILYQHSYRCVLLQPRRYFCELELASSQLARRNSLHLAYPSRCFSIVPGQRLLCGERGFSKNGGLTPCEVCEDRETNDLDITAEEHEVEHLNLHHRDDSYNGISGKLQAPIANASLAYRDHLSSSSAPDVNSLLPLDDSCSQNIASPLSSSYRNNEISEEMAISRDFVSGFSQVLTEQNTARNQISSSNHPQLVATRAKLDLSHHAVRKRESVILESGRNVAPPSVPTTFRNNTGMRRILSRYMQHLEPILSKSLQSKEWDKKLDRWLTRVFPSEVIQFMQTRGYDIQDVVAWSWILNSSDIALNIKRYVVLCRELRSQMSRSLPLFIPLQILRSPYIGDTSFASLIAEIETDLNLENRWDKESGTILLIRLLRHARLTRASLYERITELAPMVVPLKAQGDVYGDIERLTHFYNRFLSLLALPTARHPYQSVGYQQRAQLKIARFMMESSLHIPLNREGYRALARLQLMHKKTTQEQQWSSVKAPSWPPWRRDELGIDARIEYPGRQSRVEKVIKRLLESGYGPESVEHEAKILAGWDLDKSPTIQVRRISRKRPLVWIRSLFETQTSHVVVNDSHVWAARVAATRSVREAWICFYAYMHATMKEKRHLSVYHEMFYKLFARVQQTDQKGIPSPGDGKEVFDDPTSLRDLAYVPKEPPSIEELYAQMLQDGIRPAGRLLAGMIDSARSLQQGLGYLNDSALDEVKKDVLLHPEKYPQHFISRMFTTLPDYLLASYFALLSRRSTFNEVQLYLPGSRSAEEGSSLTQDSIKPLQYCLALMDIWRPKYLPAYHAVLEGVCTQAKTRRSADKGVSSRQFAYSELWGVARHILDMLYKEKLCPDLICFRKLVVLLRHGIIRAPGQFARSSNLTYDAIATIKVVFIKAVGGLMDSDRLVLPNRTLEIGQQPYWKDIEALILLLGYGHDFAAIIDVLRWLDQEHEQLECIEDGSYKMQRLMCSVRTALEVGWMEGTPTSASVEQIEQAKIYTKRWTWPEIVDLEEYMEIHAVWLNGMRAGMKQ